MKRENNCLIFKIPDNTRYVLFQTKLVKKWHIGYFDSDKVRWVDTEAQFYELREVGQWIEAPSELKY